MVRRGDEHQVSCRNHLALFGIMRFLSLFTRQMSHSPLKRQFPPLYQGTGDSATDRLAFFHILERLKVFSLSSAI